MSTKKSSILTIRLLILAFLLSLILVVSTNWISDQQPQPKLTKVSNYTIHHQQNFNQPQFYPINQTIDSNLYKPISKWVGRLILPPANQIKGGADWVWLEVQVAPWEFHSLIGKVVRLEWQAKHEVESYVKTVKRDVHFTNVTRKSVAEGIIHPQRLDGRMQVGPLQSLAGARPNDDVIVALDDADLVTSNGEPLLQIQQEPVLVTGRFYGLVKILSPEPTSSKYPAPSACPGALPCPSEFFTVRHYNSTSSNFDGVAETIRIPQQIFDQRHFPPSTPRQLETSPVGEAGWYIYGAQDAQGIFTVQSIAPRSLFQLQPDKRIFTEVAGLDYIHNQHWQITARDKGTISKVSLATKVIQKSPEWQVGDRAILLHNFGGIGGKNGETSSFYTITGHFAFGLAEVVRDPFTHELQFAIQYQQIYAQNPDGIIAGKHSWADYMGNLAWGWAATRPVSDVLIKFAPVTQDYDFDGIKLSPLQEFQQQLQIMMARYRIGDGTGAAIVSAATSCVQDSNQALYIAIKTIKQQISANSAIQKWLDSHPDHPQTQRFQQLVALGVSLEQQLVPLGIVRTDWESNANLIAGISSESELLPSSSIWAGLKSWRTMLPRGAHDQLATLFLKYGAQLWLLRTNQIGGWNPDILPVAPTVLLGQIIIPYTNITPISLALSRILGSLTIPTTQDGIVAGVVLLIYSAISLPIGFFYRFLHFQVKTGNWQNQLQVALTAVIFPALSEELVFRVLFLPHPLEDESKSRLIFSAILTLLFFILYHPLNAKTFFRAGIPTFYQPVFLVLAGLLGLSCIVTYELTGSLWVIAFIHWIVVVVWLLWLGGIEKLSSPIIYKS